jgi:hypothetical protein
LGLEEVVMDMVNSQRIGGMSAILCIVLVGSVGGDTFSGQPWPGLSNEVFAHPFERGAWGSVFSPIMFAGDGEKSVIAVLGGKQLRLEKPQLGISTGISAASGEPQPTT